MPLKTARRVPVATYRIQLHRDFDFSKLIEQLPYLCALGISDVYCSPLFAAAPGSKHGYDVGNYRKINPELGGEEGFQMLCAAIKERGMGLLLDFVPNHMGISGPLNPWWTDVLECGLNSPFAPFFDIQWNDDARDRVLVPMLEDYYGVVLEKGAIKLQRDKGTFALTYGEARFPVSPESYPFILGFAIERLPEGQAQSGLKERTNPFSQLPTLGASDAVELKQARRARVVELKQQLASLLSSDESVRAAIDEIVQQFNGQPGQVASFDRLDHLIARQHYRLARWKAGAHEINYRRFFAVDTLVGLRMEKDDVFRECHQRVAELVKQGQVTGLRIDHIDGLWDPERYLGQLQDIVRSKSDDPPLYVLVEKIIEGSEQLPEGWLTQGTTGYEFMADLGQLLVDSRSAARFSQIYEKFIGDASSSEQVITASKHLILEEMFANAVNNLAQQLDTLLGRDRRWCDLTHHELTVAIREIIVHLGVYRSYRRPDRSISPADQQQVEKACSDAIAANPRLDPEPFRFIEALLIGKYPSAHAPANYIADALGWVMMFQQYTGAIMAKSVEDTAFYLYNRLIALNEVGGNPGSFGSGIDRFHLACQARSHQSPLIQLATSTHDSKFSEDARARLFVISEMPEEWETWLAEWQHYNAPHKTRVGAHQAPDANEEYRLYQTLLAAWPLDGVINDAFKERIRENLRKSISEAKHNTTWINPNEPWLAACDHFVDTILDPAQSERFWKSFMPVADRIARLGMINSLVQTALKLTAPGIPDFYQGNETWNFSLVDPDNRRPVDFTQHRGVAEHMDNRSWFDLLMNWRDGAMKQRLTRDLLRFRADHLDLFQSSDYSPVPVDGLFRDHIVAFIRKRENERLLVVVPRLSAKLGCPPLGLVWDNTRLQVDPNSRWRDTLTGKIAQNPEGCIMLADLFSTFPIAVLQESTESSF